MIDYHVSYPNPCFLIIHVMIQSINHSYITPSLGPILFSMYLLPLIDIFHQLPDINYYLYADDLHIYIELLLHASF